MRVSLVSSSTLEPWHYDTPFETGIGGSETAHIELANRLERRGTEVFSYVPLPDSHKGKRPNWFHYDLLRGGASDLDGVVINFRNPQFFDGPKPPRTFYYFVAQDTDYPWTPEQLAKVDRYIVLCPVHNDFTLTKYPQLKGRTYVSTNGVRSDVIATYDGKFRRDPNRFFYASSPDRGLQLLLEQFWRIRERIPDAQLRVAYGLNNVETIIKLWGDKARTQLKSDIERLVDQPGVTWLGRLNQAQLYEEWFQANLWLYPSDWPETSAITCMDAQACGAFPVTTSYWATEQNVQWGWKVEGLPQKSEVLRHNWLSQLYAAYEDTRNACSNFSSHGMAKYRWDMQTWAREQFDWESVVDQYINWIQKDEAILRGT